MNYSIEIHRPPQGPPPPPPIGNNNIDDIPTEIQIETPKRPPRGLPAPTSEHKSGPAWEILPDGTAKPLVIGPNTLQKNDDHDKSEMEKAEDELYKNWSL